MAYRNPDEYDSNSVRALYDAELSSCRLCFIDSISLDSDDGAVDCFRISKAVINWLCGIFSVWPECVPR